MGYISKVAFMLYEDDYNKLLEAGENLDFSPTPFFLEPPDVKQTCTWDDRKYVLVQYNRLKFYDGMEDVDYLRYFIGKHPHMFFREGEEYRDIEFDVGGYYDDYNFQRYQPSTVLKYSW